MTVGATILPISTGFLTLNDQPTRACVSYIVGLAILAFLLAVGCWVKVLLPLVLDFRPELSALIDTVLEESESEAGKWFVDETIRSIEENEVKLSRATNWVTVAVMALGIEAVSLAAAALLTFT